MRIGGLQKQSLIDWPGRLVAVIFTKGCNFRCGYCHNPSLVVPHLLDREPDIPEEEVFGYLLSRRHWLQGVVVTGGEPTLHADLLEFLKRLQRLGLPVKLDTNGTHPDVLSELFRKNLVNFVALDVKHLLTRETYARVTPTASEGDMEAVARTIALLRDHTEVGHMFRTTVIPGIHSEADTTGLSQMLAPEAVCFQKFRNGTLVRDCCPTTEAADYSRAIETET